MAYTWNALTDSIISVLHFILLFQNPWHLQLNLSNLSTSAQSAVSEGSAMVFLASPLRSPLACPYTYLPDSCLCVFLLLRAPLDIFSEGGYLLPTPRPSGNQWDLPYIHLLKRILFRNEYFGWIPCPYLALLGVFCSFPNFCFS